MPRQPPFNVRLVSLRAGITYPLRRCAGFARCSAPETIEPSVQTLHAPHRRGHIPAILPFVVLAHPAMVRLSTRGARAVLLLGQGHNLRRRVAVF
jgi:hypothetical protein